MSNKTYIAQSEETVFDMALKLYKDVRGVNNLLLLNSFDLNATTYFGQSVIYDDSIVFTPEVFAYSPPESPRDKWIVRQNQNAFDLAVQIYGDVSNLDKILSVMLSLDDLPTGTLLDTDYTDNILANTLFSQKLVATSALDFSLTVDTLTITADSTLISTDADIYL